MTSCGRGCQSRVREACCPLPPTGAQLALTSVFLSFQCRETTRVNNNSLYEWQTESWLWCYAPARGCQSEAQEARRSPSAQGGKGVDTDLLHVNSYLHSTLLARIGDPPWRSEQQGEGLPWCCARAGSCPAELETRRRPPPHLRGGSTSTRPRSGAAAEVDVLLVISIRILVRVKWLLWAS